MSEFITPTKKLLCDAVGHNIAECGLEDTCHSLACLLLCFSSLCDDKFEKYSTELGDIKITHYEDPLWIDRAH